MHKIDCESSPSAYAQTPIAGVGAAGIVVAKLSERDPYEALDDLMSVIEVFCPVWPPREHRSTSAIFLL